MDLGLNAQADAGWGVSLTLEELVTLFISGKLFSMWFTECKRGGCAEIQKDDADHEEARKRRCVLLLFTTRVRQREEALGPSRGMFYSRGETSIISPPCVTDSTELFISLVQRETHQEAPWASSSHEDSVLYWSRRRFGFTFKCARGQRECIQFKET